MRAWLKASVLLGGLTACAGESGTPADDGGEGGMGRTAGTGGAAYGGAGGSGAGQPGSCDFGYDDEFVYDAYAYHAPEPGAGDAPWALGTAPEATRLATGVGRPGDIAHAEPEPPFTFTLPRAGAGPEPYVPPEELVLPGYGDDMPLFERAGAWTEATRCYETPRGAELLTEAEAYDLYRAIAERTTGVPMDTTPERRTVIGLRGSYPGRFAWHGNRPNRFDDTLVLLWIEEATGKHVRELPVNTDTGAVDFGVDSSSSLRPNRRYRYVDGWHNTYNALHIDETDYRVRDDHNHNGHWDSDRNGWLPPLGQDDHDRTGGGHNIHMGSVDAPLGTAAVDSWSAGCQVIPGMANWLEFITNAWTAEGDGVDYFLVDARDIAPEVWAPCTPDGSHDCPYAIPLLPFSDTRSTASEGVGSFDLYNCSDADESGPEIVYLLTLDTAGILVVTVDATAPADVDVHLLDGNDAAACLARDDTSLSYDVTPGRYIIVADTFVAGGEPLAGAFTLEVSLE